jgi:hypothetical protein
MPSYDVHFSVTLFISPCLRKLFLFIAVDQQRLASKLESSRLPEATKTATITIVKEFLTEKWEQLRFFTFAENEAFLNFIVDRAVSPYFQTNTA